MADEAAAAYKKKLGRRIDGKHSVEVREWDSGTTLEIVNLQGVPISTDEPLFLLRARDRLAVEALLHYREVSLADGCTDFHMGAVDERIKAFRQFSGSHPELMKQPGITRGK